MIYEQDEIHKMTEFYADKPGTFALIMCCPIYTIVGLNLLIKIGEEYAPSYEQVIAKTAQCLISSCRTIKPIPGEFVTAHENGVVKTLFENPQSN